MLLLQGRISPPPPPRPSAPKEKYDFMCNWPWLGSKVIVVKCTTAIFFCTADCDRY